MMIREAIEFHFECLELDGDPVPVRSAWIEMTTIESRKYLVVYEQNPDDYVAYVPDFLPDYKATGNTVEEVRLKVQQAINAFLWAKKQKGEPMVVPSSWAEMMEIAHPSEVPA